MLPTRRALLPRPIKRLCVALPCIALVAVITLVLRADLRELDALRSQARGWAAPSTTQAQRHSRAPVRPFHATDPRFDAYAVGVKSGVEVALDKVPIQLVTFLKPVRNVWLFGDGDMRVADYRMEDVVTGLYENTERALKAMPGAWERANTPILRNYSDPEPGTPGLPPPLPGDGGGAAHAQDSRPPREQPKLHKRGADLMQNARRSVKDREVLPNQASRGWRMDAHKNIPALRKMVHMWPDAKWYIMLDDDTYMFMENLHYLLSKLNSSEPWYIGGPNHFRGCDGVTKLGQGPMFAHGGSGIIVSREAARRMVEIADDCIIRYQPCWAGDVRLGLCLRDAGVLVSFKFPGRRFFNAGTPHISTHPYYEDPCKRVVTFHHLSKDAMQKMYNIEQFVHNMTVNRLATASVSPKEHPHLFLPENTARASEFEFLPKAVPSAYYSPIHLEDMWHHFVEQDQSIPDIETDTSRAGETYKVFTGTKHAKHCLWMCTNEKRCRAWEYEPNGRCSVKDGIPRPVKLKGHAAGIIKGRFHCNARSF